MRYVLISDGSSDNALLPVIDFLLKSVIPEEEIFGERADLGRLPKPPKKLEEKIIITFELYEPDFIFIHRDAEKMQISDRENEIDIAINKALKNNSLPNLFKVIPIRMTESWLLIDEKAIKCAASNPNSRVRLQLPNIRKLESIPDPKGKLEKLIMSASELSGRRLQSLNLRYCIQLVSMYINDFSILENLSAYNHLKSQIVNYFEGYE